MLRALSDTADRACVRPPYSKHCTLFELYLNGFTLERILDVFTGRGRCFALPRRSLTEDVIYSSGETHASYWNNACIGTRQTGLATSIRYIREDRR